MYLFNCESLRVLSAGFLTTDRYYIYKSFLELQKYTNIDSGNSLDPLKALKKSSLQSQEDFCFQNDKKVQEFQGKNLNLEAFHP